MEADSLALFRRGYLSSREGFVRHDFARVFGGLPASFEWHPFENILDVGVARGPQEVVAFFEGLAGVYPDWDAWADEFVEAGEDRIVVRCGAKGTAAISGIPLEHEFFQVWEFEGGAPVRVREFITHEEMLAAIAPRKPGRSLPAASP